MLSCTFFLRTFVTPVLAFSTTLNAFAFQGRSPFRARVKRHGEHNDASKPPRPHILFLMADAMDGRIFDDMWERPKPAMSNLWSLFRSGAQFQVAYSSAPLCVPARTSMLTGRLTSEIRVWGNEVGIVSTDGSSSNLDPHCVKTYSRRECESFVKNQNVQGTFVDKLADGGYNVTLFGKMHAGAGLSRFHGDVHCHPWTKGNTKLAMQWTRATGLTPSQNVPRREGMLVGKKPGKSYDYDTIESCVSLLEGGLFKSASPQFLYCSLHMPHPPWETNATFKALDVIAQHESQGEGLPKVLAKRKLHPADEQQLKLKGMWKYDQMKRTDVTFSRKMYFAMCAEADVLLGQVVKALDHGGGRSDAYIIMVSDHGELAMEHGQMQKNNMYEGSLRVPFFVTGPGIAPSKIRAPVSLLDLYPTILDIAQLVPNTYTELSGETLLPIMKAPTQTRQEDHVVAEYHAAYSPTGMFMVRQGDLKLMRYGDGPKNFNAKGAQGYPPQLFNLTSDPDELRNIARKSPQAVKRLTKLLHTKINVQHADRQAKAYDKVMFEKYWYEKEGGAEKCKHNMRRVFHGNKFENADGAKLIEDWLGKPCGGDYLEVHYNISDNLEDLNDENENDDDWLPW